MMESMEGAGIAVFTTRSLYRHHAGYVGHSARETIRLRRTPSQTERQSDGIKVGGPYNVRRTRMEESMHVDRKSVPHYLIVRAGCAPYVLNADRLLLRREASRHLCAFARARGKPMSIEGVLWDGFAEAEGFSTDERVRPCFYALVRGDETEHQLRLLAAL